MIFAMSDFANLRQRIGELMVLGGTIEEAEELLDQRRLPSDQLAALWLYAWALMDSETQRHKAVTYLEYVGT
jgi:hypothetical protein